MPPLLFKKSWIVRLAFLMCLSLAALVGCSKGESPIYAIAIHPKKPQIIYASTDVSIFKSRDGGTSWEKRDQGLEGASAIALAIDPILSATLYAGTFGKAIFKSMDSGQRWQAANIGMKGHVAVVNDFAIDSKNTETIFAALTIGPYMTTNAGVSWHETVAGMESVYTVDIEIDPTDSQILYAGTSGGMYRSMDRGKTWKWTNQGLIEKVIDSALSMGINSVAIDPVQSQYLFIGSTKGLFATDDRGDHWVKKSKGINTEFISRVLIDPIDRNTLYAGTTKGVFKSTDRGEHWYLKSEGLSNLVIRSMGMDPKNPKVLYAGTQKGLFKSNNGAETWELLPLKVVPPQ